MKRSSLVLLTAALAVASTGALADDTYLARSSGKFGSGVLNAATGWTEIPKTMYTAAQEEGAIGLPVGFFKGLFHTVGRTMIGVMDLATFYIPTKPMVTPGLIWENPTKETSYNTNWELYETK
jgi:putative exosortase-associated protein (TIGR04073 family)